MKLASLLLSIVPTLTVVVALNGDRSKESLRTYEDWKHFEVVTQGDRWNGYKLPGQFDGTGAYLTNNGRDIRVLLNHETKYGCDTENFSSVSEIYIDKKRLKNAINNMIKDGDTGGVKFIKHVGLAYDKFRTKDGRRVTSFGGPPFWYFCSGHLHKANEFGPGRGFVDDNIYIFGEEDDGAEHGRIFALANKTLHAITGSGPGDATKRQGGRNGLDRESTENAAMIDTGETKHIALLFSPDYGQQRLRLYVGVKGRRIDGTFCGNTCTGEAGFLARNGLAYGSWYYLQGRLPSSTSSRNEGTIGTSRSKGVYGRKLEDVSTNPNKPTQVVLAEEDSGVYILDFALDFASIKFSPSESTFTIRKLDVSIQWPDNVEWTKDGAIFIQKDSDSGRIYRRSPSGRVKTIARTKRDGESAGIVDISDLVDQKPGTVLLTNSQACPGNSMSVLISPNAKVVEGKSPEKAPQVVWKSNDITLNQQAFLESNDIELVFDDKW